MEPSQKELIKTMQYYMPTKFFFGKKCLSENADCLSKIGNKALITTGKNSAKISGALGDTLEVLKKLKITYEIFDQIKENPDIETISAGVDIFKQTNCDFIIGIGGGSPIDAAKAISAIAVNNIECAEIYKSEKINKIYPIVAIPTTSGTGTEVTPYSVITSGNKKAGIASPHIFPKFSFIDPSYTLTLNYKITRDTSIDALSHLLEGIYSTKTNNAVYPLIINGITLIYKNLNPCLENHNNLLYRERLMLASLYGGMVIAQTGTTLQHSIGYPLTCKFNTSHGLANGIVLKEIMDFYYKGIKKEIDELFDSLGFSKQNLFIWLDKLDLKFEHKLSKEFIELKALETLNSRNITITPIKPTLEDIKKIYNSIST